MTLDDLCARLGLAYSPDTAPARPRTPWDGSTLHGRGVRPEALCHEIAHWVCALPRHRRYIGFGCGPVRDGTEETDGPRVARVEESIVVVVEILLTEALGLVSPPADTTHRVGVYPRALRTRPGRRAVRALSAVGVAL